MTKDQKYHPISTIERTTLPGCEGGRGFADFGFQEDQQNKNLKEPILMKNQTHQASIKQYTRLMLQRR